MKTNDFSKPATASSLNESMFKKFGTRVNFNKYSREQLEDYRNILRTKVSQRETGSDFNELQTNETHQRDKYMLNVLNARIKEMLGESIAVMERALSVAQQKAAGAALASKHGGAPTKGASADMAKMSDKELKKIAGTKLKGLPKKVKEDDDCDCDDTVQESPSTGMNVKQKSKLVKDAKSGKDIGEPGKNFDKVAKKAAKQYGSKESGEKVAAAAMWKNKAKKIKESVETLIMENEEEKAQIISAGIDMVQDFTSWMQRIGSYQTKSMLEMGDDIRSEFGRDKSDEFKGAVQPALANALDVLTQVREQLSTAIAVLAGEAAPESDMLGADTASAVTGDDDTGMPSADEFGASDAATGGNEPMGRAQRESKEVQAYNRIDEAHSIMTLLAK